MCPYEIKAKSIPSKSPVHRNSWRLNTPLLENDGTEKKPRSKKNFLELKENKATMQPSLWETLKAGRVIALSAYIIEYKDYKQMT